MRLLFFLCWHTLAFVVLLPAQPAPTPDQVLEETVIDDETERDVDSVSGQRGRLLNGYEVPAEGSLQWKPLLLQNGLFLGLQHGYRFATQEKTRSNIRGPFFRDYIDSIKGFSGWDDGDEWVANYLGHPMQGSVYGFTYLNNHTREKFIPTDFKSKDYWKSRFKSMAWMTAASTHYELGPLGEAAFGNVGLEPGTKGAVDLVITPTLGLATLVVEDFADAKLIMPIERRIHNRYFRLVVRSLFNPSRSMANLLSFKVPWHRNTRAGVGFQSDAFPRRGQP
jgi:hypothetical protein